MIKKMPATLSTPCDIIGQKAAFFEFFRLASELAMSKKSSKIKGFRDRKKYFCEYLTHSDDLGRVVIPKEIRRTLRIREGDPLEIFTDREGEIILKKYSPIGEFGMPVKLYAESLSQTMGCTVCITDTDQVIAVSGAGKKDLEERFVRKEFLQVLGDREVLTACQGDDRYVKVTEEMNEYEDEVISPIISAGDIIGAVVLLNKDKKKHFGEVEQRVAVSAADFLGRQME